jgi:superfamily I DNA and/or RNA helicase
VPYLISGPPGTGKTKTLVGTPTRSPHLKPKQSLRECPKQVESAFQILEHHPNTSILVVGASNSSADTVARRLQKRLGPKQLFRLNDPSRPFDEVSGQLLPYCHSEPEPGGTSRFALPPIE